MTATPLPKQLYCYSRVFAESTAPVWWLKLRVDWHIWRCPEGRMPWAWWVKWRGHRRPDGEKVWHTYFHPVWRRVGEVLDHKIVRPPDTAP